jgi:hypothetical protein
MQFETVYTIRNFYDSARSGTADLHGAPHYFASIFDEEIDDYTQYFRLYAVTAEFMERELRLCAIFRTWQVRFRRGLEPLETHPSFGGVTSEYGELNDWLNEQIKTLAPIPLLYTATFRELPKQEEMPFETRPSLEVAWKPVSPVAKE